ncbi:MAG: hypothetical protein VZS44_05280 [Bacilli bacterium]|nr:hypothetical protein [Bacilli bacterium]
MNLNDHLKSMFSAEARNKFLNSKNLILQMLSNIKSVFHIKTKNNFKLTDIAEKANDSNYLNDYEIQINSNGFSTLYLDSESWNEIKNNIPHSIKELRVPSYVIDESFLQKFELDKLIIDLADDKVFNKYKKNAKEIICYKNDTIYYMQEFSNEKFKIFFENYNFRNGSLKILSNDFELIIQKIDHKFRLNYTLMSENDVYKIIETYNYIKKSNKDIESINLNVANIDYFKLNYDQLKEISDNEEISFKYKKHHLNGNRYDASYKDMEEYIKIINSIKLILKKYDNPLTKYLIAFLSVISSFEFAEDEEFEHYRAPHLILKEGKFVCEGISNLLVDLCMGVDKNLDVREFGLNNHMRIILKVCNGNYNGIYVSEPTWVTNNLNKLYDYFLLPYKDSFNILGNNYSEEPPKDLIDNNNLNPRWITKNEINGLLSQDGIESIKQIISILKEKSLSNNSPKSLK